jgi:gliding motility-associated-like protein
MLLFFLLNENVKADICMPGNTYVTLYTQNQVDSFPINYPGCTEIDGYLTISGADITNLNGLSNIHKINSISVSSNPQLVNLSGLSKLDTVYSISISNNQRLTNLVGLNKLKTAFYFTIEYQPLLINMNGLDSFNVSGSTFEINNNDALVNLEGLNNLSEIWWLYIHDNKSLINLVGLTKLTKLNHFNILNNLSLINLSGLNNITTVDQHSWVQNNPSLTSLEGLNNLQNTRSTFNIINNSALINFNALRNLNNVGSLSIQYNPSLIDMSGLSSLSYIENSLDISFNTGIVNLIGLNNLNYVGRTVSISNNIHLVNLIGLDSLKEISWDVYIHDNSALENLVGLEALNNTQRLYIYNNGLLKILNGLNSLIKISDGLLIYNNRILSCCYLAKLIIENNPTITTIYINENDIGCNSEAEVRALTPSSICCITSYSNDTVRICQGSTYSVGSHNYTTTGIYRDTIHIGAGCDSIIITNLTVHPTSYQIQNKNLCFGQSFTLSNGRVITTNGTYRDSLQSIFGCDSIIEYRLSFLSNISVNQNPIICKGKTYSLPKGNMVSVSGIYRDTLRASFGCDSIVITNLTVTNPIPFTNNVTICRGKTFKRPNGNIVSTSGIYYDTIKAPNTCDSIVISNLTVTNPTPFNNNVTICSGKTFTRPNGNIVSTAGVYYDTIKAPNTCDSIVITNLTVTPYLQSAQTSTVCLGKSFVLPGGRSVSQNGIYKDTIRNNFGCDSIITTNLTITNPIPFTNTVAICDGQSYTLPNGNKVSRAGIYKDTLRQLNTCDSIIVTNLSVFPNNFTVSLHASDTVESGNGITLLPVLSFGTAVSWNWTPAASLSCTACENPVANPTQNTLYTVTVKATDGCEDTAQTNIIVRRTNVYIPSAFTPNNDGVNDVAEVFAINPKSFSFKIYNRWGELVFESYDVSNKWNGTFKGEDCPQDNYSYILDVTMQNDKTYHKQGGILLLR